MKIINKLIASVVACTVMAVSSAVTASAATARLTDLCGGATVVGELNVYSSSASATTTINHTPSTVSVTMTGRYSKKGTSIEAYAGNGNGSTNGGTGTTIYNGGGTWISVSSTHSAYYNGYSTSFTINA